MSIIGCPTGSNQPSTRSCAGDVRTTIVPIAAIPSSLDRVPRNVERPVALKPGLY